MGKLDSHIKSICAHSFKRSGKASVLVFAYLFPFVAFVLTIRLSVFGLQVKSHAQKVAERDPNFASLKPARRDPNFASLKPAKRAKQRKTKTIYQDSIVDASAEREENSSPVMLRHFLDETPEASMEEFFSEASHPPILFNEATLLEKFEVERKRGYYYPLLRYLFRVADFNNEREVFVKPDGSRMLISTEKLLRVRIEDTLLKHKQIGWFLKEVQPDDKYLDELLALFVIMADCTLWYRIDPNTSFPFRDIDAIFSIISLTKELWDILQLNAAHISYVRLETINGIIQKVVSEAKSSIEANTPCVVHQPAHSF